MAEINKLPNLIIVGAPKCGTTSLFNYLGQHPNIILSKIKEPHFLVHEKIGITRLKSLITNYDEYKSLFEKNLNIKYKIEASALYLLYVDEFIKNAKKYLEEDVKIIVCVRNPVERAYSAYNHVKRYNVYEKLSFEEALRLESTRFESDLRISPAAKYFEIGLYYKKIKKILDNFKFVKVIVYEDFISNPKETLRECMSFLNINNFNFKTEKVHMKGGWVWKNNFYRNSARAFNIVSLIKPLLGENFFRLIKSKALAMTTEKVNKLDKKTKKILYEKYRSDINNLSKLLKKDLKIWEDESS